MSMGDGTQHMMEMFEDRAVGGEPAEEGLPEPTRVKMNITTDALKNEQQDVPLSTTVTTEELLQTENFHLKMSLLSAREQLIRQESEKQLRIVEDERQRLNAEIEAERTKLATKYSRDPAKFQIDREGNIVGG